MSPKTIVITGASDGIGKSAAELLVADGHHVVIVGLEPDKTAAVATELGVPFYVADFSDLQQVRELAAKLSRDVPHIDVLANNAGAIFGARKTTRDGFEITFQVNYLAPYLLTTLLLPRLTESRAAVINTASVSARLYGKFDIDDLPTERDYSPERAYGNSKVALILFTRELDRRFRDAGISTVSFHPGNLATNFASGSKSWMRFIFHSPLKVLVKGPEVGGRAMQWLINGTPGRTWRLGQYYEDDKLATKQNPKATDMDLAKQLWDRTADLLGIATH